MKIVVFGLGYVGATTSACLLKDGHSVVGIDVSPDKAAKIAAGQSPSLSRGWQSCCPRAAPTDGSAPPRKWAVISTMRISPWCASARRRWRAAGWT